MVVEEKVLIDQILKRLNVEYLKCDRMYQMKFQNVYDILYLQDSHGSNVWKDPLYAMLLTKNIWYTNLETIKYVVNNEMLRRNSSLLTPRIWLSRLSYITFITTDPWFQIHPNILSPHIWNHNLEQMQKLISYPYWQEAKYQHLIQPDLLNINTQNIEENIELFARENIDSYLTINDLRKPMTQNLALINYLKDRNIDLVVEGKLHPIFSISIKTLKEQYNIDVKALVQNSLEENTEMQI